ncbi:MAG: hemerythrin family protein [Oscillospiraceae bacterium]|nr:hemerythrin family protein [Oscillospiraceae bacterium]
MTWNDNLKIGVPAIDTQHKMLCDAIDSFLDACKNGKGRQEIVNTISFLEQYTIRHFHDEEIIHRQLAQVGYPKVNEHKAMHDNFIKKVQELKEEVIRDGASIVTVGKINSIVVEWLLNHIKKVDQELETYVNKK